MENHLWQNTGMATLGLILLGAGIWVWMFVGRRRFMRRNIAGIEEFNGYGGMLVTRFAEKGLRVFAVLLVLGGFGLMMSGVSRNQAKPSAGDAAAAKVAKPAKSPAVNGAQPR